MPAACAWLRYEDQIRTHVEVMERIAMDAAAAMASGTYRLRPADLQTMAYPLERASELLKKLENARVDALVRERFTRFVGAYGDFYQYLDRVRTTADEPRRARRVDEMRNAVTDAAAAVREALAAAR